jgi:maltooligosyltrehalose trehalohydrolase
MTEFRVWAPRAGRVALEIEGRRVPMGARERGWWAADVAEAGHGSDYAFVLDGGEALPDPRSPWQPEGPHGRSRVVDHARFPWTDAGWQPGAFSAGVVYELHVGTFSPAGTFEGAIERLEHLVELGVTWVELMPVAEFPGKRGWGYDGVDLYAPHHAYGGPEGLKRLVDACHARGLAVMLDVVYNHLGPDGNYLDRFGPYFTERYTTPWGRAVNLDGRGSDQVRRFLIDNALMWLRDYHFDGLRIDAVHAMFDMSALHFLEQLAGEVAQLEGELGRRLALVAESDLNDPRLVRARRAGGYGLDAQWNEDFHHALHARLTGEQEGYYADFGALADLAKALRHIFVYDGRYSVYRGRRHGRPPVGLPGCRFVGFLQNHDQVGNRAQGERSSHLLSTEMLKVAAALVLMAPFVPLLFQGEEWGAGSRFCYFSDHQDPELAEAVRRGRREEFAAFGWDPGAIPDPQAAETFEASRLDWSEPAREPHAGLLDWYRRLIRLRRERPYLQDGRMDRVRVAFDEEAGWLKLGRGPLTLACNLAGEARSIPLRANPEGHILLASQAPIAMNGGGIRLAGEGVVVVEWSR